jgi:hypothetical protein
VGTYILVDVLGGGACAVLAMGIGRRPVVWGLLGLVVPLLAMAMLIVAPKIAPPAKTEARAGADHV